MTDANKIIQDTNRVIGWTLGAYIIISIVSIVQKLQNDTFTSSSYMTVALGVFIIYSLYRAQEWAKLYITISCVFIVIFSTIPFIRQLMNGVYSSALINLSAIIWSVYLIRFLNVNDQYEKYCRLVKSGMTLHTKQIATLDDIIPTERSIDLDRKSIHTLPAYLELTKSVIGQSQSSNQFESISAKDGCIFLETVDTEFELAVDANAPFFNDDYINKLNIIIKNFSDNELVTIVYPYTIANKRDPKIIILTYKEYDELKSNGMI